MSTTMGNLDLDSLILYVGRHDPTDEQMCVMEAVAFMAGEPWSDHPHCVSMVIGDFLRAWNDGMRDDDRQMLVPLIPRVVGTAATTAVELKRSYLALDWFCRVSAPAWLRLAGLTAEAEAIEAIAPIVDAESAKAAQSSLQNGRKAASAARDAARAAARDAVSDAAWDADWDADWDAVRAAAWAATWAAARDAAWVAARDAAWVAVTDAVWDAAWDAVRDAVRDAAWVAAWDAVSDAARDAAWDAAREVAWDAAHAAAWAKLRPTAEQIQVSAIDLVERMIAAGQDAA